MLRILAQLLQRHLTPAQLDYIKIAYGECPLSPHRWQAFVFWMASCIRCSSSQKYDMFVTRSAIGRVDCVVSVIKSCLNLQAIYDHLCQRYNDNNNASSFDEYISGAEAFFSPEKLAECAFFFYAVERDFSILPYSTDRMFVVYAAVAFVFACVIRGLLV